MGASSSRARGGQQRGGRVLKDGPRRNHQRQKTPRQSSAAATQGSPRRVVPAGELYDQSPVNQNAAANSDNAIGVDRRGPDSVDDDRNSNEGVEASQVSQAMKTLSITHDDEIGADASCGLEENIEAQEEPKENDPDLPVIQQEEEEECAICLEGYDEENPKLYTQCEHHYHFHCILEWIERSENCPMCGQVAIFDDSFTLEGHLLHVGSMDQ